MRATLLRGAAYFVAIAVVSFGLSACCDEKSVPGATRKLYSSIAKERNDAALELARCGDAAAKAVPRLATLLYDENIGVQSAAAYALRQIDTPKAREVLEKASAR